MTGSNPFDSIFPGHRSKINALRQGDPSFDELCTDFEDLYTRIPAAVRDYSAAMESLQGLEREIRDRLQDRAPGTAPAAQQKRPVTKGNDT